MRKMRVFRKKRKIPIARSSGPNWPVGSANSNKSLFSDETHEINEIFEAKEKKIAKEMIFLICYEAPKRKGGNFFVTFGFVLFCFSTTITTQYAVII